MIAPLLDDDDVPAVTYDLDDDSVVVIVGSGAGGGTVADELTRRGFAGGFWYGTIGLGLPFYAAFLSPGRWGRDYARWIEAFENMAGLFVNGEDMALATSRVTLHESERDEHGLPIPSLNLDDYPNDLAMKRYGYRNGIALLEAAGARSASSARRRCRSRTISAPAA